MTLIKSFSSSPYSNGIQTPLPFSISEEPMAIPKSIAIIVTG